MENGKSLMRARTMFRVRCNAGLDSVLFAFGTEGTDRCLFEIDGLFWEIEGDEVARQKPQSEAVPARDSSELRIGSVVPNAFSNTQSPPRDQEMDQAREIMSFYYAIIDGPIAVA